MDRKKAEILAAHRAEMDETAEKGLVFLSAEQVEKAQIKYATLCAEYAACREIYKSYRDAGLNSIADPFATGTTVAGECARAAGEILDILGISHQKPEEQSDLSD